MSLRSAPSPGTTGNALTGVSCRTATRCTAVGQYVSGGPDFTLAEHWGGGTWVVQRPADPVGYSHRYLDGISCTKVTSCTEAGWMTSRTSGASVTLAESN